MSPFEIPEAARAAIRQQHAREVAQARASRRAAAAEQARRAAARRTLLPLAKEIVAWAHAFVATGEVRTRVRLQELFESPGARDVVILRPDGGLVFAHSYKYMGGGHRLARSAKQVAEERPLVVRALHGAIRTGEVWNAIAAAARR